MNECEQIGRWCTSVKGLTIGENLCDDLMVMLCSLYTLFTAIPLLVEPGSMLQMSANKWEDGVQVLGVTIGANLCNKSMVRFFSL